MLSGNLVIDCTRHDGIIQLVREVEVHCVRAERAVVMAGPQFLTPKPVRPSRPRRHFTLLEANSSLPLVKRIVADIVRTHGDAAKLQQLLERGAAKANQNAVQDKLEQAMHRLEDYVDELSEVGCDLKDYQAGLIDFTGRHQGRDVCLCWKLGEEKIAYWHELDSGFAGRKPIALLQESE